MEGRIARLESDVAHIQKDVAEMKVDLKSLDKKIDGVGDRMDGLRDRMDGVRDKMDGLRDKMEAGFTDVRRAIAQLNVTMERAYGKARFATLETRVWGLSTLGAVLLLMARAFKWI